jgi:glycosidase
MEDFIFGTLSTDALKNIYHRASHAGIQHAFHTLPRDPKPGDPVTIIVETGPDMLVDEVACYYSTDGCVPTGSKGNSTSSKVIHLNKLRSEWDTLSWGYRQHWEGTIPGQSKGTRVQYLISGWGKDGDEIYADWPDVKLTIEEAAKQYFKKEVVPQINFKGEPNQGTVFSYDVDNLVPPQWAREAVIYHIFVDRFFPGRGREWLQTDNPKKAYGGTLWGVFEKLDYIKDLGATAIWLSPIFPSPSIHRYDAFDYEHVAEELGGDAALKALVYEAHKLGIRVILDLVCNHISNEHPIFQEAQSNNNSPYQDWFYFYDSDEIGYRTFFGVRSMPQLNLNHPAARAWMLDIARYWLEEFDVDGYRLDHANGPGPGFWGDFWHSCKQVNPESFCIGEVVEPPEVLAQYQGRMDGLLDFHLCDAIRRGIGTGEWDEQRLKRFISDHRANSSDDLLMGTFLDNHDMNRFLYTANNNVGKLKMAAELQFEMPGPPIIYYGTEVGLQQKLSKTSAVGLEASRGAMVWGEEQDLDLFAFYQTLIARRQKNKPWANA